MCTGVHGAATSLSMALVESLLTAIVRADGDALVMHVGERPYVVASAGPIELSTQGLNLQAMAGMVAQMLPAEAQRALTEFGAVEHELASQPEMQGDRFTVVVARGGDDVWIEVRRHRRPQDAAAPENAVAPAPVAEPAEIVATVVEPAAVVESVSLAESAPAVEGMSVVEPIPIPESAPAADVTATSESPDAVSAPPTAELVVMQSTEPEPIVTPPQVESVPEDEPAVVAQTTADEQIDEETAEPAPASEPERAVEGVIEFPVAALASAGAAANAGSGGNAASAGRDGGPGAPVIPLTRTLRIEVPPPSRSSAASEIERLLTLAAARGATALYLTTQASPYVRVDADVRVLDGEPPLSSTDVEAAVLELMPEAAREVMRRGEPTEWEAEIADIGPVRCATFRDHRGPGAIFQLISMRPTSAEALGLAAEVRAMATEVEGLVLVASPRAGGKTTLVGALVDIINRQRPTYVITLERQIQIVHEPGGALISQREVRGTAEEWAAATRSALRESPDVLVIEDLAAAEACQLAVDAAGNGVLVIASVTAVSTTAALMRLVELFPQEKRRAAQSLLAERLRGAVAQTLLRKVGGGRVAAREVLLTTPAVTSVIGEGQFERLDTAIESGRTHGLMSLTDALVQLVRTNQIDVREAYRKAADREALVAALKHENLEAALVERLA